VGVARDWVGVSYWLLGLGWARQGRARGGQRIAGINSTDAAWYGGLKDRVEKDIEWVASWKTEYFFNASSDSRTNHCFDRELMKDCRVRCEIQIAFFFSHIFLILLMYFFVLFCLAFWDNLITQNLVFFFVFLACCSSSHNLDVFFSGGVHFLFFSFPCPQSFFLGLWKTAISWWERQLSRINERLGFSTN